jgi:hypothetical protein
MRTTAKHFESAQRQDNLIVVPANMPLTLSGEQKKPAHSPLATKRI